MAIEECEAAPAFTFPDAGGSKSALENFRGKKDIVPFYPKDDTPGRSRKARAVKM